MLARKSPLQMFQMDVQHDGGLADADPVLGTHCEDACHNIATKWV
jgi:hypothetical protein